MTSSIFMKFSTNHLLYNTVRRPKSSEVNKYCNDLLGHCTLCVGPFVASWDTFSVQIKVSWVIKFLPAELKNSSRTQVGSQWFHTPTKDTWWLFPKILFGKYHVWDKFGLCLKSLLRKKQLNDGNMDSLTVPKWGLIVGPKMLQIP